MAAHSFHVLFCVVFQNFYAILQKICTLIRVGVCKYYVGPIGELSLSSATAAC